MLTPSRRLVGGLLLLAVACARIGSPAGGPPDDVPPVLIGTVPESVGVYPDWNQSAEFRFDEIVSEGGSPNQGLGTGDLEKLILLSPTEGIPVVRWKRDRITVRPREGWKPNRVYRLELLPGVTDLRRNKLDTTEVLTFSTGGPVPTDTLGGLVIDWVAGRPARAALVELVLAPDSLIYRTLTDSSGHFTLGPLPRGSYAVYGAIDQNHNLRRERRELYDSTSADSATRTVAPLWLIPRDTIGPRIQGVTADDSLSATITFSGPLDPYQNLDSLPVRLLLLPDSVPIPHRPLLTKVMDDSLQKLARAAADSLKALSDTTKKDSLPAKAPARPPLPAPPGKGRPTAVAEDPEVDSILASRPKLFDRLVLRVDSAFVPEAKYVVIVEGIRSAAGVASSPKSVLSIPKPKPVAPAAADSLNGAGVLDSLPRPADSIPLKPTP